MYIIIHIPIMTIIERQVFFIEIQTMTFFLHFRNMQQIMF